MIKRHYEKKAYIPSPTDIVFVHLDDHTRLSSHMSKPSWKVGGGRMQIELDEAQGKTAGSRIRLAGRVFGIALSVEEIVTEHSPPFRKVWETTGSPELLVIGKYRMGFELTPQGSGSVLRVFIDYDLPEKVPARWLGHIFGGYYAKWCVQRMVGDAEKCFSG